jgi:hypothetical protein
MALIACTKLLAKDLDEFHSSNLESLGTWMGWHAHLIKIQRRKCIVAIHDETRFTLFFPGITKPLFKEFRQIFIEQLLHELSRLGLEKNQVNRFIQMLGEFHFVKSHNRSVLGTINDMVHQIKAQTEMTGKLPISSDDIILLNAKLNSTPCHTKAEKEYFYPHEKMFEGC